MSSDSLSLLEERTRPEPPEIDGYLDKLKSGGRSDAKAIISTSHIFNIKSPIFSWNRRYFKVNKRTECLEYYTHKTSPKCTKAIHLSDIQHATRFESCTFELNAGQSGKYMLKAQSSAELTCWVNALNDYAQRRKEYNHWLSLKNISDAMNGR